MVPLQGVTSPSLRVYCNWHHFEGAGLLLRILVVKHQRPSFQPPSFLARKNPSDGTNSSRLSWPSWAGSAPRGKVSALFATYPGERGFNKENCMGFHGIFGRNGIFNYLHE